MKNWLYIVENSVAFASPKNRKSIFRREILMPLISKYNLFAVAKQTGNRIQHTSDFSWTNREMKILFSRSDAQKWYVFRKKFLKLLPSYCINGLRCWERSALSPKNYRKKYLAFRMFITAILLSIVLLYTTLDKNLNSSIKNAYIKIEI